MPYYMSNPHTFPDQKIALEKQEFEAILLCWKRLSLIADVEEIWDCVIQNYIETETAMLNVTLRNMLNNTQSHSESQDERLLFSRHFSNLLSSCRSYIDQAPAYLKRIVGKDAKQRFDETEKLLKQTNFSVMLMDVLRNHAQHNGMSLHGVTYHSSWLEDLGVRGKTENGRLRYAVTPRVSMNKLLQDKRIDAGVAEKLASQNGDIDVAYHMRLYLEQLGEVHKSVREMLSRDLESSKRQIRDAISRYEVLAPDKVWGLSITHEAEAENIRINIFEELIARIEILMRRNNSLVNLSRRYISSERIPL